MSHDRSFRPTPTPHLPPGNHPIGLWQCGPERVINFPPATAIQPFAAIRFFNTSGPVNPAEHYALPPWTVWIGTRSTG